MRHTQDLVVPLLVALVVAPGCTSLRNTSLDHRLPPPARVTVDLGRYRPVQERADGQEPGIAIAAAISGGGHRAANFAAGVLLALEAFERDGRPCNLLKEIDYFSTVSGGGFAAGTYISTLHDHLQATGGSRAGYSLGAALERDNARLLVNLERDYQGSVLASLLCPPCLGYRDGGDILERKIDRHVLGSATRTDRRSLLLADIFRGRADPRPVALPYWVTNATVYENGARFAFTPGVLARYEVTGFIHNMKRRTLDGDPFRMPVAVGVKASASFPVVFPATTLACVPEQDPLNRFLHLLDGGLTDNTGYRTAIDLLRQDKSPHKILLIIDAYKGVTHPYSSAQRSPAGVEAAHRIMKISLDSDHGEIQATTALLREAAIHDDGGAPIHVIVLDFAGLKPALNTRIGDLKDELARLRSERAGAAVRRVRRELDIALKRDEAELQQAMDTIALYHDARAVPTSLNITRGEQHLLLEAGKAVVHERRAILEQHVVRHLAPPRAAVAKPE